MQESAIVAVVQRRAVRPRSRSVVQLIGAIVAGVSTASIAVDPTRVKPA